MAIYRKKPVIVEARKYTGDDWNIINLCEWMGLDHKSQDDAKDIRLTYDNKLPIKTLEGIMMASIGDYIIKGVKNEFYPCKPDIFEETYELLDEFKHWE